MPTSDTSSMFPPRPTALAQDILRAQIHQGDWVIDATAGNGHDTLFLANCVGSRGRVLAFDVQMSAIESAREKVTLAGCDGQVEFFHECHSMMDRYAEVGTISAILFNLGYLPGEGHDLTTLSITTLAALDVTAKVLKPGGVLSVVCYPGHPAGEVEADIVETWMTEQAAKGWWIAKYGAIGTRRPAPFLLLGKVPLISGI